MKNCIRNNIFMFFTVAVFVVGLAICMPKDIAVLVPDANRYVVFCRSSSLENTDNGICKEVAAGTENLRQVLSNCLYVDGVTAVLSADTDIDNFVEGLRAEVVEVQRLPDVTVYLCFSKYICGGVYADGQVVNLQIAVNSSAVYVGSPLLLGSY